MAPHPATGSHLASEGTAPPYPVAPFRVVAPCPAPQKPHTPPRPATGFRIMTAGGNARHARRHEILKELGLTPLWRARAASTAGTSQPPELPQERQPVPVPLAGPEMQAEPGEQICSHPAVNALGVRQAKSGRAHVGAPVTV